MARQSLAAPRLGDAVAVVLLPLRQNRKPGSEGESESVSGIELSTANSPPAAHGAQRHAAGWRCRGKRKLSHLSDQVQLVPPALVVHRQHGRIRPPLSVRGSGCTRRRPRLRPAFQMAARATHSRRPPAARHPPSAARAGPRRRAGSAGRARGRARAGEAPRGAGGARAPFPLRRVQAAAHLRPRQAIRPAAVLPVGPRLPWRR
jgi:hypothetical protein